MAKTKAERLAQQRLYKRRKYAEIKNDPELYALEKEKQRAKYKKRKEEKKQKSITERSPREQRQLRKQWKANAKKYRQRKKEETSAVFPNVEHVQADGFCEETNNPSEDPIGLFSKQDLQKEVRKIRYRELKKRIRLTSIIKNLQKINKNQKITIMRLKSKVNKNNITNNRIEGKGSRTRATGHNHKTPPLAYFLYFSYILYGLAAHGWRRCRPHASNRRSLHLVARTGH